MSGGWAPGPQIAGAAVLAVERVNADKMLLPGRRLVYSWENSGCSAKQALKVAAGLLGGQSRIHAMIGPGCSSACQVTSYLSSGQNMSQIGLCTSPTLSNKSNYEFFSRTVAPETSHGPTLIALITHYKWQRASLLSTTEELWFETGISLARQLQAAGIEVPKPSVFEPGNFQASILREIKRSGIRITMLLAYDSDMTTVAAHARPEGMLEAGYAWILTEALVTRVTEHMHGWLFLQSLLPSEGVQGFAEQVSKYTKSGFNITVPADSVNREYSLALYSAIMLYAHAATKVLLEGGNLLDGRSVTAALRNTSFVGVGGQEVVLDSKGDRIMSYR